VPDFVQTAVKEIDEQLRVLKDEAARLEAARAALTGGAHRTGRTTRKGTVQAQARKTGRRAGSAATQPRRRGGNRANQALELVREKPGITIPEIASAMKIQPNYLYRVLPRLASDGQVTREGQGWHPAPSSTSTPTESAPNPPARRQSRAAKPTSATNGRTTPGATKASVLAALAGGESMTAGQVATKAGLARPTVSTTLSKLAKTGEVQKAERGYRLTSTS